MLDSKLPRSHCKLDLHVHLGNVLCGVGTPADLGRHAGVHAPDIGGHVLQRLHLLWLEHFAQRREPCPLQKVLKLLGAKHVRFKPRRGVAGERLPDVLDHRSPQACQRVGVTPHPAYQLSHARRRIGSCPSSSEDVADNSYDLRVIGGAEHSLERCAPTLR